MALRPAKFLLYSRWWTQLGELDVLAAEHRQQINSEDELSLDLTQPLSKGDRILWTDGRDWHEHVVDDEDQEHDGGETFSARCVWSLQADLSLKHVRQWVAHDVSLPEIVSTLLDGTSWEPGTLESDVGSASFEFTRKSVYQCLLEACGAFGCELRSTLETGPGGVESRLVDLVPRVGADTALRFEYGVDLAGVTKRIEDEPVITACYGYGATLDTKTDGVQDRLWCYVTSESAKELWGLPDGKGGTMHAEGTYEFQSTRPVRGATVLLSIMQLDIAQYYATFKVRLFPMQAFRQRKSLYAVFTLREPPGFQTQLAVRAVNR